MRQLNLTDMEHGSVVQALTNYKDYLLELADHCEKCDFPAGEVLRIRQAENVYELIQLMQKAKVY